MTPDATRTHPPRVLTRAQREAYFETGFLAVEGLVPNAWLQRLNVLSDKFIDRSRLGYGSIFVARKADM